MYATRYFRWNIFLLSSVHAHARAELELVKELNYSQECSYVVCNEKTKYESKIGLLQAEATTTRREGEFLQKKKKGLLRLVSI